MTKLESRVLIIVRSSNRKTLRRCPFKNDIGPYYKKEIILDQQVNHSFYSRTVFRLPLSLRTLDLIQACIIQKLSFSNGCPVLGFSIIIIF